MANGRTLPVLASALAAAELGILLGPAPVRVTAGLTLVLILPGLVITRVVLARLRILGTEQLLLVPGMSLAMAVIIGLVLNTVHVRLTAANWAGALGLVTAVGLLAGVLLEDADEDKPHPRRPRAWLARVSPVGRRSLGSGPAAMLVIAALATSAAVAIGVLGQRDRDNETEFTELWALPGPSSGSAIRLGVRSHERRDVRYRIRVSIEGRVVRDHALTLQPGRTWQSMQPVEGSGERVDVALLTSPRGRVYREVHLAAG